MTDGRWVCATSVLVNVCVLCHAVIRFGLISQHGAVITSIAGRLDVDLQIQEKDIRK